MTQAEHSQKKTDPASLCYAETTPSWTSSAKSGIGTALGTDSLVWFTLSHGIVNEVYYPTIDIANIRDMGLMVTDGKEFVSEEKRDCIHTYEMIEDGTPAYILNNICFTGRYQITKKIVTDEKRSTLLQEVVFTPLVGKLEDYKLFVLLTPHVNNQGKDNHGWCSNFKGYPMLFAEREGVALALSSSSPFIKSSAYFVGEQDGWHQLKNEKDLKTLYTEVPYGNISLVGEIDLKACGGKFILALGFGQNAPEAAFQARASLFQPFDKAFKDYVGSWKRLQEELLNLSDVDVEGGSLYRTSLAVIKSHEGKRLTGGVIASLSIPWGNYRSDTKNRGYDSIWPRDVVKASEALLAAGDYEGAREGLLFLMCTQEADGHWAQFIWQDGRAESSPSGLDETALPILLADHLERSQALYGLDPWPMIEKASLYLLQNGPMTLKDRWEETGGISIFAMAVQIAALRAAARYFQKASLKETAEYLVLTAEFWTDCLNDWLYVKGTSLAKECKVDGYYVFSRPAGIVDSALVIADHHATLNDEPNDDGIVGTDALALARYGVLSSADPRLLNTVKVIDHKLKSKTSKGVVYHRYTGDTYGEHADGTPFDGTGIGRGWPLLSAERGIFALSLGKKTEALEHLRSLARFAGLGKLIPEQIWDSADLPEKKLFNGRPTGSAKPLVLAHAEYILLLRSLKDDKIFDAPPAYQNTAKTTVAIWSFKLPITEIKAKKRLIIQTEHPSIVHYAVNSWYQSSDIETHKIAEKVHIAELPLHELKNGEQVHFTFYWPEADHWEGRDFTLTVTQE